MFIDNYYHRNKNQNVRLFSDIEESGDGDDSGENLKSA